MKRTTLRTARMDRQLSVRELARLTNGRVSAATISRIENRTTRPLAEHIMALEAVLGVPLQVHTRERVA